jgi:hypothetical protein
MEVAPDAGFADASASGGVVCESHCEAVCNCATEDEDNVTNRMVVKARFCLILVLARDKKETKLDTVRRQPSLPDMWYLLFNSIGG